MFCANKCFVSALTLISAAANAQLLPPASTIGLTFVLANPDPALVPPVGIANNSVLPCCDLANRFPVATFEGSFAAASVESVAFVLDGPLSETRVENVEPYAVFGDTPAFTYNDATLPSGDYALSATAFSEDGAQGDVLAELDLSFSVDRGDVILGFSRVDPDTDQVVGSLNDGDVLNERSLNVIADVCCLGELESVFFELEGRPPTVGASTRTENVYPYTLFGDTDGDFIRGSLNTDTYTLTATAYSEDKAQGTQVGQANVTFSVGGGGR